MIQDTNYKVLFFFAYDFMLIHWVGNGMRLIEENQTINNTKERKN